jgi:hypothetical protein
MKVSKDPLLGALESAATGVTGVLFGVRMHALGTCRDLVTGIRGRPSILARAGLRWLQWPVDTTLYLGGRILSVLQGLLFIEARGRRLHSSERALGERIFGDAITWSRVRVKEQRLGLFAVTGRAFVLGDVIFAPRGLSQRTLVHELVHVWQYQHGGLGYLSSAIWAQWFGAGYDHAAGIRAGKAWHQLNPEQQAQWVEDHFSEGLPEDVLQRLSSRQTRWP